MALLRHDWASVQRFRADSVLANTYKYEIGTICPQFWGMLVQTVYFKHKPMVWSSPLATTATRMSYRSMKYSICSGLL